MVVPSAEPPGSPYPPADGRLRALARSVDVAVALTPLWLAPAHERINALLCVALLLFGDSLFGPGRSLGKRLFGLRVISLAARRPAGLGAGVRRNAVFAAASLVSMAGTPHWVFGLAGLALALAVESAVALMPRNRDVLGRRRLGDLWAGTQVIDASIALKIEVPKPFRRAEQSALTAPPAASRKPQAASTAEEPACASP